MFPEKSQTQKRTLYFISLILSVWTLVLAVSSNREKSISDVNSRESDKSDQRSLKELYDNYNEAPFFDHWMEYAERYQTHMPDPRDLERNGEKIRLLEIGVQSGGSVRVWKQFYGKNLIYTGLDIDSRCKRSESIKEDIYIEIGSQDNASVLKNLCEKYGPFDVIIDDGGHSNHTITTSLVYFFPKDACLRQNALYIVEDTHTVANGVDYGIKDIPSTLFSMVHKYWADREGQTDYDENYVDFAGKIKEIHLYDSMIFIKRGIQEPLTRFNRGSDRLEV